MADENRYDVLNSFYVDELIRFTNEKMKEGWKPKGGIIVTSYWDSNLEKAIIDCYQAIVKEPEIRVETIPQHGECVCGHGWGLHFITADMCVDNLCKCIKFTQRTK